MNEEIKQKFLTNTSDSGRFIVTSVRTGKTYYIEPIGHNKTKWGSLDPATKKLTHKKGDGKYRGAIDEKDSLITEENGFVNIQMLEPGVSPFHAITVLDSQYPNKVEE